MDSLSAQANAEIQGRLNVAGNDTKALIYDKTGVDVNNARVQQGAVSTVSLIQHGYDPLNDNDNAALIHSISGGLCLIPGGAVFGAYVELLWTVGQEVACPLEDAFSSIGLGQPSPRCGGQPCASTGGYTTASVLAANQLPPGWNTRGSFASVVIPALASYAAANMNCKGGVPPGAVVDAMVAEWNSVRSGPAWPALIPPIGVSVGGGSTALIAGQGQSGDPPYIKYGFQGIAQLEVDTGMRWNGQESWTPFTVPSAPPGVQWTSPRVVMLNVGPVIQPPASTAKSVATHAAVLAGGGLVGGLMLAFVSGQSANVVFGGMWNWVKNSLESVEGGVRVATHAGEHLGRRRRR